MKRCAINVMDKVLVRPRESTHLPVARAEDLAYGILPAAESAGDVSLGRGPARRRVYR